MSIEKLNIEHKQDSPAKQKLIASGDISSKETLTASEINSLTAKTNELVDAYNFGAPITAFNFKTNVPTYADLPLVGNEVNDGYGVVEDGLVYVWNGTAFPPEGDGMDLGLRPDENSKVVDGNPLAVSGGEVFNFLDLKKTNRTELIEIYDVDYVVNLSGNLQTVDPQYHSRVAIIELKQIGNYYIQGFQPINNFSLYHLQDENGDKIDGGYIQDLPTEFDSNKITTTSDNCKLYLNVFYDRFPQNVQNENLLHVFFNQIPEEIINKDFIYEANNSYLRQFLEFSEGVIYKKYQQVSYNGVVYEVIKITTGAENPDNTDFFKRVAAAKIGTQKTKNIFNFKTDVYTGFYLGTTGNITTNPSNVESKVVKIKLELGEGETSTDFAINQYSNGNNHYRIENLTGEKIAGGTLSTVSEDGIGRKINITEDVYFYHLVYFKNTTTEVENSIPDINTYQIEKGDTVTSFEPYEKLVSINDLPINPIKVAPNRYHKKRVLTAGDSITAGTQGGYVKFISEILGCEISNYGSSGSKTGRMVGILTDIKDRSDTNTSGRIAPDYTIFEGGIIMIGTNIDSNVGSLSDIPADSVYDHIGDEIAYFNTFGNTYYGNLSLVIEWIKWKNPEFVINLVSPPYNVGTHEDADLVSQRMQEIANYYSINFIDATHQSGLTKKMVNQYTYDGTHFNEMGNEVFGRFLGNILK